MSDKVAVVTGATGAIGGVILEHLVGAGYQVVACGRNTERLLALQDRYGKVVTACPFDLEDNDARTIASYLDPCLEPWGYRLDLLVTAHGAPPCLEPSVHLSWEAFHLIQEVDVLGTFLMAQVCAPHMLLQTEGGTMIFVSSIHAHATYPSRAPYACAKAAVNAMARALSVEWGHSNITVNSISPWQVCNVRTQAIAQHEYAATGVDSMALYRQRSPLGRLVAGEDIARVVLMLAENRSMSGQDIVIDTGVLASAWHMRFEHDD